VGRTEGEGKEKDNSGGNRGKEGERERKGGKKER
jgi:hypothetical protein